MTYVTCDIETAKQICLMQDPSQAVLLLGPHGVGKSQIVYQIGETLRHDIYKDPKVCAKVGTLLKNEGKMADLIAENGGIWSYEMGIPVIERRLSQMGEGELTGVPRINENELLKREVTKFTQLEFLSIVYEFPVILFFDELNRAFPSLRQATFQIADSKIFLGNRLHKDARVFVAANIGAMYQADDFDVAEFSRYAVIGTQYDSEAWLKWATNPKNKIHNAVISYITKEPTALYTDDKKFATNTKTADPRAWAKVGNLMTKLENEGKLKAFVDSISGFKMLVSSLIGPIEGAKFAEYCKETAFFYGAKDVFQSWPTIKKEIEGSSKGKGRKDKIIHELSHKIIDSLTSNSEYWFKEENQYFENLKSFLEEVPPELFCQISQKMLGLKNNPENKKLINDKVIIVTIIEKYVKNKLKEIMKTNKN